MHSQVFKEIMRYWQSSYYVDGLAILCQCIALVSGIRYYRKRKEGLYFILYTGAWLTGFTIVYYIHYYIKIAGKNPGASVIFYETCIVLISIVEYTCLSWFQFQVLTVLKNKNVVKLLALLFAIPVTLFFVKLAAGGPPQTITHLSYTLSSFEMTLLMIPCLLYFYELFTTKAQESLFNKPSFWIISALFLYCIIVIPFFLLADRFISGNRAVYNIGFTLHLSSFSLLFLALVKAFSLNKKLTD